MNNLITAIITAAAFSVAQAAVIETPAFTVQETPSGLHQIQFTPSFDPRVLVLESSGEQLFLTLVAGDFDGIESDSIFVSNIGPGFEPGLRGARFQFPEGLALAELPPGVPEIQITPLGATGVVPVTILSTATNPSATIPEPSTLALLGLGALGMIAVARRPKP